MTGAESASKGCHRKSSTLIETDMPDLAEIKYSIYRRWRSIVCWGFIRRWTTIKPRTVSHDFMDYGDLMPHLMFECLVRYMENDRGLELAENDDPEKPEHERQIDRELIEHYEWWKGFSDRCDAIWSGVPECPPADDFLALLNTPHDEWPDRWKPWRIATDAANAQEEELEAEIIRRCHRLVELSPCMWS